MKFMYICCHSSACAGSFAYSSHIEYHSSRLIWKMRDELISRTHTYSFLISKLYLRFSYFVLNFNHMSWNIVEYSFRLRSETQIYKQTQPRDCFKNYECKNTLKIDKHRQKVERKYAKNLESYFKVKRKREKKYIYILKSIRKIITWFYN